LLEAAVTVTVVPLTVQPPAITVALCTVALHIGVVYVCPMVIVQLVDEDIAHVPPVATAMLNSAVLLSETFGPWIVESQRI
jgi:hypothetical protein